jgi:CheY-like chemotaxis protein
LPGTSRTGVDLPSAIEKVIEDVAGEVEGRQVTVVAEYPAHLPAVAGDEQELAGVLARLTSIAAHLIDQGEVNVRAELLAAGEAPTAVGLWTEGLERLAEGGPWALVNVSFRAPSGTEAPIPDALLGLDRRADTPAAQDRALALSECRQAIEALGGALWVETTPRDRLAFGMAIPLMAARSAIPDVSPLRRVVDEHLPERAGDTQTLLLLVEGDDLRSTLAHDLVDAGYRVILASGGADVLALSRAEHPDLILLDLLARSPNAFDVAMVLKQDRRTHNIPVLFLTSVDDPHIGGKRMEAVNFMVRPAGTGALVSAIHSVLNSLPSPSSRVLVVEPDDAAREMMILMIQAYGYRVTEATGPEEALAIAEHVKPGLILLNAKLAQERDYWLVRGLRQVPSDFEIFVLADAMSDAEGQAAISRGASGYSETDKLPDLLDRVRGRKDRP